MLLVDTLARLGWWQSFSKTPWGSERQRLCLSTPIVSPDEFVLFKTEEVVAILYLLLSSLNRSAFQNVSWVKVRPPEAIEELQELDVLAKKCKALLELDFSQGPWTPQSWNVNIADSKKDLWWDVWYPTAKEAFTFHRAILAFCFCYPSESVLMTLVASIYWYAHIWMYICT